MHDELADLLADARVGEMTADDFEERLEEIHARHLGEAANEPALVAVREEARGRYAEITLTIERHHQLERLAETLGVGPTLTPRVAR